MVLTRIVRCVLHLSCGRRFGGFAVQAVSWWLGVVGGLVVVRTVSGGRTPYVASEEAAGLGVGFGGCAGLSWLQRPEAEQVEDAVCTVLSPHDFA
jgi:hypothetical protein